MDKMTVPAEAPMTTETASLLVMLRVAGAPLLTCLPIELLHMVFVAGGLEQAEGWHFKRSPLGPVMDAVSIISNFAFNTRQETHCYRLNACPLWSSNYPCMFVDTRAMACVDVSHYPLISPGEIEGPFYMALRRGHVRDEFLALYMCTGLLTDARFGRLMCTNEFYEWVEYCVKNCNVRHFAQTNESKSA